MTLELAVRPSMTLAVDGVSYRIEFPLRAVVIAEERIGKSLKSPADWFTASAKDVPALLEAGLSLHHPEITRAEIEAICDRLTPECYAEFTAALGALAFPRFTARYQENLERLRAKSEGGEGRGKVESAVVH